MPLQAVIGPQSLKSFTKTITCLSRYGDEAVVQASSSGLILAATNSSKSAFSRVKFTPEYFSKYKITFILPPGSTFRTPPDEPERISGQLIIKALISILKHKTVEKSVDQCEIIITDGGEDLQGDESDGEKDSLESNMIVRLHCKYGVVKTHRLVLMTTTALLAPRILISPSESRFVVGPRVLKDILEHFPYMKGGKNDPQLVWLFAPNDIKVKTLQTSSDVKGKSQISTEISMSADEIDSYQIFEPPVSIGFHLREFNATLSLAESLSVALVVRFTESTEPIYIELDTDSSNSEYLFVISTTDSVYDLTSSIQKQSIRKRGREDGENDRSVENAESSSRTVKKRIQQAAVITNSVDALQSTSRRSDSHGALSRDIHVTADADPHPTPVSRAPGDELFMPGASQLSNADMEVLRQSGLGIEHMDDEEFEAMMEAEGEEVGMSTKLVGQDDRSEQDEDETQMEIDYGEMPPTQPSRDDRNFQPLFED